MQAELCKINVLLAGAFGHLSYAERGEWFSVPRKPLRQEGLDQDVLVIEKKHDEGI